VAVRDVFSAHLITGYLPPVYPNPPVPIYEDITSGIINVNIEFGTDVYEGPYQQIDTGLFTIVSRGSILDPKINSDVIEGATIEFRDSRNAEEGKTNVFFQGYITDIDVQYQREDNPIITITGTDAFGLLQRTVVSENIKDFALGWSGGLDPTAPDFNGPSLTTLVSASPWEDNVPVQVNVIDPIVEPTVPGSIDPSLPYNVYLGYNPARYLPELGETLLEVLNKYTQTNLNYCSIDFRTAPNIIDVYPYAKYNAFFWPPIQDPALEFPTYNFSSDPADGRPYESILINNGYNRRSESLAISNETRVWSGMTFDDPIVSTTTNYPPYKVNQNDTSVATNLDTIMATAYINEDALDLYAQDIFQVVNFGSDEIQQITFDNARFEDVQNDYTYSFSQLNQFIRIKHQLTENQIIDRFYDIAGITHNITPDKWEMGFTFKPAQNEIAFTYQGQLPTIQMNSLTGDSNFNFTATITDFPTEDIDYVIWCLNGTNSNVNEQWLASAGTGEIGSRYKDGLQRNGLTQTWNFDDDGILNGPEFPTGGYGTGEWYVIPYIILKNGWVIAPHVKLTVGTPSVDADFFWTQNLTNNFGQVTFTDDSHNNEIGEPDSYLWNFGDGTTSTLQNPVHIYDPAPDQTTYSVSLRVFAYGVAGEKVFNTRTRTVTLARPTMVPNFTWVENPSGTIVFTNTSTNVGFEEPDAYLWDFGDGTTSTLKNPSKQYFGNPNVPTNYSVKLTTRNIWEQTADVTKTITVTALYATGTTPVNQIGIETSPFFQDGGVFMSYLKALRSDGANLSFNAITSPVGSQTYIDITTNPATLPGTQLTRNPATSSGIYGLKRSGGTREGNLLITSIPETLNINSIKMSFDDRPAATYPLTIWDRIYATANDPFGSRYPIGYWDLPAIPNYAPRQNFGREYTMTPIRPMPPKIPYFRYTFDNRTVSFVSAETGTAYAWTFGDGTTSTVKNPIKTYAAKGTYTVSLTVTFAGGGTRTTTEPVIVEALAGYPVRYIKFAQKDHTGINAWDTPFVSNVRPIFNRNALVQTSPVAHFYINPISIAKAETYSMQWYGGTTSPGPVAPNLIDPISPTSANNTRLYEGGGIRVKSLDGTFRTKWELVGDFGTAISNIDKFHGQFSRWSNYDGTPNPVCAGISYEVFVTDYVGAPSGISGATWTKIGEFNPTNMPLNPSTTASAVASIYTMTPL